MNVVKDSYIIQFFEIISVFKVIHSSKKKKKRGEYYCSFHLGGKGGTSAGEVAGSPSSTAEIVVR